MVFSRRAYSRRPRQATRGAGAPAGIGPAPGPTHPDHQLRAQAQPHSCTIGRAQQHSCTGRAQQHSCTIGRAQQHSCTTGRAQQHSCTTGRAQQHSCTGRAQQHPCTGRARSCRSERGCTVYFNINGTSKTNKFTKTMVMAMTGNIQWQQ